MVRFKVRFKKDFIVEADNWAEAVTLAFEEMKERLAEEGIKLFSIDVFKVKSRE